MRFCTIAAVFAALSFGQTPAPWEPLLAQQKFSEAEPLLKQAIAAGDDLPALRALSALYRATGRLDEAAPLLDRLVSLEDTAPNVEELARIRVAIGNRDVAEMLYRHALDLRGSSGSEPPSIIADHQSLAKLLAAEKKFPEAETEGLAAIALRVRASGA